MSERTIFDALRAGGLSPAGACGVMGNMWAESGLRGDNVQDNCPMGDKDYTYNVDHGIISKWQFMSDSYGYGLCQWTYSSRKCSLYEYAKRLGVSIADEAMQCGFCIEELENDFPDLFKFLRTTNDLAEAAKRVCAEFEKPAVNNFSVRINAAQRYYNELAEGKQQPGGCAEDSCPIGEPENDKCTVEVGVLRKGDKSRTVFLLQCGLQDMGIDCGIPDGDFGPKTMAAVIELQRNADLDQTGVADQSIWQIIFS